MAHRDGECVQGSAANGTLKSEVEGTWFNSGNDVSKQSQQLSNLIAERVDAIIINAASPTALNGIIAQGASRGILMVAFDNTVTSPSALTVNGQSVGVTWAEWLVKNLNGKGNVVMVTGVAGTFDDEQRNKGADDVWAKNPGIKVVTRYNGKWDTTATQTNTAAILPSLPKIDGVWCQGGADGVMKAFIAAKRPLPPTAGTGENGFRKFMMGYMARRWTAFRIDHAPFESVVALELARPCCVANIRRRASCCRRRSSPMIRCKSASTSSRISRTASSAVHRFRSARDRPDVHRGGAGRHAVRRQAGGQAARVNPIAPAFFPPFAGRGARGRSTGRRSGPRRSKSSSLSSLPFPRERRGEGPIELQAR